MSNPRFPIGTGIGRISMDNEAAALRSLEPHLGVGEELLVNTAVHPNRGRFKRLRATRLHVEPAAVDLPDPSVFAVSSRRFFVVSHSLKKDHVSALLMAAPLEEVRSVRRNGAEVSWNAGGTQYVLWTNGRFAEQVARALQR